MSQVVPILLLLQDLVGGFLHQSLRGFLHRKYCRLQITAMWSELSIRENH